MQLYALIVKLPRKAEIVGEGAQRVAIAEEVMVPLPHHRAETQRIDRAASLQRPPTEKALNQPQSLQARVAVLADDQMIMHGNFQGVAHRDDLTGELDVVGRRLRIAGWMIVDKDDRRSAEFERAAHDLPGIDRGMIDRADALNLVGDQMILLVEKEHAKFLVVEEGHRGAAVIDDGGETRQRRPLFDRGFGKTFGRRLDNL
jgi:hypothetical protein